MADTGGGGMVTGRGGGAVGNGSLVGDMTLEEADSRCSLVGDTISGGGGGFFCGDGVGGWGVSKSEKGG